MKLEFYYSKKSEHMLDIGADVGKNRPVSERLLLRKLFPVS
jgi:hypothetical protein